MIIIDDKIYYTTSDLGIMIEINEKLGEDRRLLIAEMRKIHEITEKILSRVDSETGISCNVQGPRGGLEE